MQLLHSLHEGAHAHRVRPQGRGRRLGHPAHQFLGAVIHRVEFSELVGEPDALEEGPDLLPGARQLEIVLTDAHLREGRREQEVHGFGLVSIVL